MGGEQLTCGERRARDADGDPGGQARPAVEVIGLEAGLAADDSGLEAAASDYVQSGDGGHRVCRWRASSVQGGWRRRSSVQASRILLVAPAGGNGRGGSLWLGLSRWDWVGPDLALDLALWPRGQFQGPWVDPFRENPMASLVNGYPRADPKYRCNIIILSLLIYKHLLANIKSLKLS
jgi:hypothetical protein